MPKPVPHLCLAAALLRKITGLTEAQVAEPLGCTPNAISDYERGQRDLSRERAEELVAAMRLPPAAIDAALELIEAILAMARRASLLPNSPGGGHELVTGLAGRLGEAFAGAVEPALEILLTELGATVDRQEAAAAWDRLKRKTKEERLFLVRRSRDYRSWALCELVCAESLKAAPDSSKRCLELAELAVEIAQVCSQPFLRPRAVGYAGVHLANAHRVDGQLRLAKAALAEALPPWEAGALNDPGLFSSVRVLSLRASLSIELRNLHEALALLEKALALDRGELKAQLLVKRGRALEQLGRYPDAITTLREAAPLVARDDDRRLQWVLQFNLTANLCHLGRFEEAAELLPAVRALAVEQRNGLDLLRTRGLEGWIHGGMGDRGLAISTLEAVRDDFAARGIAFDTALVTLDLAVLYLEEGRTAEVKTVAGQLAWVFEAEQGVHREALAALGLFCEAARRETLTLELARKLREYLFRARDNPDLRFEGSPC